MNRHGNYERQPDGQSQRNISGGLQGRIEPRFEALREAEVRFKLPGEVVTGADEDAEHQLKSRLGELVPEALFVARRIFERHWTIRSTVQRTGLAR